MPEAAGGDQPRLEGAPRRARAWLVHERDVGQRPGELGAALGRGGQARPGRRVDVWGDDDVVERGRLPPRLPSSPARFASCAHSTPTPRKRRPPLLSDFRSARPVLVLYLYLRFDFASSSRTYRGRSGGFSCSCVSKRSSSPSRPPIHAYHTTCFTLAVLSSSSSARACCAQLTFVLFLLTSPPPFLHSRLLCPLCLFFPVAPGWPVGDTASTPYPPLFLFLCLLIL